MIAVCVVPGWVGSGALRRGCAEGREPQHQVAGAQGEVGRSVRGSCCPKLHGHTYRVTCGAALPMPTLTLLTPPLSLPPPVRAAQVRLPFTKEGLRMALLNAERYSDRNVERHFKAGRVAVRGGRGGQQGGHRGQGV